MVAEKSEVLVPISKNEVEETAPIHTDADPTITGVAEDGKFDSISTLADLKEKAPDLFRAMMQGIAMNICNDMQKHQKRFRDILKKARQND